MTEKNYAKFVHPGTKEKHYRAKILDNGLYRFARRRDSRARDANDYQARLDYRYRRALANKPIIEAKLKAQMEELMTNQQKAIKAAKKRKLLRMLAFSLTNAVIWSGFVIIGIMVAHMPPTCAVWAFVVAFAATFGIMGIMPVTEEGEG